MGSGRGLGAALGIALAITSPRAHASEPAPAPAPAPAPTSSPELRPAMGEPQDPAPAPTWDDVLGPQAEPAPPPVSTPIPPPTTPSPPKPLPPPTKQQLDAQKRLGNGLLIGAAVTTTIATLLNGLRVYVVTGPCQTDSQDGCSLGWFMATPFVWGTNIATGILAGAGGRERGTSDVWLAPEKQRRRAPIMLSLGIPLMALGFVTSVSLRGLWLADYGSPEGPEIFDFARPSHAFGYYGAQQASALAFAAGVGMVSYQAAANRERARYKLTTAPIVSPTFVGVSVRSRF